MALVTQYQIEQWLHEGIVAAKAGQREQARFRLLDVVEQDQTNEAAWFWLYQVFERRADKMVCLENLITINPYNEWARQELLNYIDASVPLKRGFLSYPGGQVAPRNSTQRETAATINQPRPIPLKLVTAFWIGISIIFLAGGIIASAEWLLSGLRNRTFPNNISPWQIFELLVALIFVIIGVIGFNIALSLFLRSMAGFYGSLLLALGLLLIGPTISLIADPPHYQAMICIGGIFGLIVLLTLASQSGLKDTQQEDDNRFD